MFESLTCLEFIHLYDFQSLSLFIYYADKLCLVIDDGRYMNHSTDPNCLTDMETGYTYAIRNIEPDEQLFEDYGTFDHPSFLLPLLQKYDCAPNYYELPERFDE